MRIKVVCLNIWLGGALFDDVLEFLRAEDPDILLLQEVFDGHEPTLADQYRTMDVLRTSLSFAADDFAPTYRESNRTVPEYGLQRGNAIFSKFPIVQRFMPIFFNEPYSEVYDDHNPKLYPYAPRNLQHVVVDTGHELLDVLNFQGVWDLNGENDSPARLQMSRKIVDAIQGRRYILLGGDTNVNPHTKTVNDIEKHLTSIFKDELITTFNMRRKDDPGYATAVVDMLFVTPNISVTDHNCPNVDISDHLPLVATIEVPTTN